jgi:hypothetical protein
LYLPALSGTHAACPNHPILLDLTTRIIFGEGHRTRSSSLCSLLQQRLDISLRYCTTSQNSRTLETAQINTQSWPLSRHGHVGDWGNVIQLP